MGAETYYVKSKALMKHFRSLPYLTIIMDFDFHIIHISGKISKLEDLLFDSLETKLAELPAPQFYLKVAQAYESYLESCTNMRFQFFRRNDNYISFMPTMQDYWYDIIMIEKRNI